MRSTCAARAVMKGRNAVTLRRTCGHEGPQCGQLAPHVRPRRAAMRSPRTSRADRKSRNAVTLRLTCGQEEPQCGHLAPHVRTGRAAMRSPCAAHADMKGRNAVTSVRRCARIFRQRYNPACPRSALDITSQPAYISCYKVEDRKTSGFGGCRRYGRAG